MGFFDSEDYNAANNVNDFASSVHSLLRDLYQSNPLQSGSLDKITNVPDMKLSDISLPESSSDSSSAWSGFLSRLATQSPSLPSAASPTVSPVAATPLSSLQLSGAPSSTPDPSAADAGMGSAGSPLALPTVATPSLPAVGAPVVSSADAPVTGPSSILKELLKTRVQELRKYNPQLAATLEDPATMVIPTQKELLDAHDAAVAAENKLVDVQRRAMDESEAIAKERYQPNWLIVAGALAWGGKKGAAALTGYLKTSQVRWQHDQQARLLAVKDMVEAAKLTAMQAGQPYERLKGATAYAATSNEYMTQLLGLTMKQTSAKLQSALAASSQELSAVLIKAGGFLADPEAFLQDQVAKAKIPADLKDVFYDELATMVRRDTDNTSQQVRSMVLADMYGRGSRKEPVTTSSLGDRLVYGDIVTPGKLYPAATKIMSVVGNVNALQFIPPSGTAAEQAQAAVGTSIMMLGADKLFKSSWLGTPASAKFKDAAFVALSDPAFWANPQGYDLVAKYKGAALPKEQLIKEAAPVRDMLVKYAQAVAPMVDVVQRGAATQLAPLSASFREVRDQASAGFATMVEFANAPEVRQYVRPEFLELMAKSDPTKIGEAVSDTILGSRSFSGAQASRAILGMVFGNNVPTVMTLLEKSNGVRDAKAAELLRNILKGVATAAYSLTHVTQVDTVTVEAAYGSGMAQYIDRTLHGTPLRPTQGIAADFATKAAVGLSKYVQQQYHVGGFVVDPGIKSLLDKGVKDYSVTTESLSVPVGGLSEAIVRSNPNPEDQAKGQSAAQEVWGTLLSASENGKLFDPRYLMAQAVYETGYFKASASPYETTNNVYGISTGSTPSADTVAALAQKGINITGAVPRPTREGGFYYSYASVSDCVRHRLLLATDQKKRLSKLGLEAESPEAFAARAKQVGYYTGSKENYERGMTAAYKLLPTPDAAVVSQLSPSAVAAKPEEAPKAVPKPAVSTQPPTAPAKETVAEKPAKLTVIGAKQAAGSAEYKAVQEAISANDHLLQSSDASAVSKYLSAINVALQAKGLQLSPEVAARIKVQALAVYKQNVARKASRS